MSSSVYDKIIQKGHDEAKEIISLGQKKCEQMTEQTLNETELKINKMLKDNELRNSDLVITKKSELEQTSKQKILANQKRLIKETFDFAIEKLLEISDSDLTKLVIKYLKKEDLVGNETIKVNKSDHGRYKRIFSKQNNNNLDLLSELINNKYNLLLSDETLDIKGGFIIEGKYFDIDYSYESIIKELTTSLETEVANKLFGE